MKIEIWRPVVGFERYLVSNYGRVKSLNYRHTGREQILKPRKTAGGYLMVNLYKDGKLKSLYVSLIVWEAFKGPIPNGMQVNHINEDKTDNRLENLNLMTPKENCNWGTRNQRRSNKESYTVYQFNSDGSLVKKWISASEAGRNGYRQSCVNDCCLGKQKTHMGYIWSYNPTL